MADKCKRDAEAATEALKNDDRDRRFESFVSLVKLRGERRKILSSERYNLLRGVYSIIAPEFTAAVLLSRPYPTLGDRRMSRLFARFLCTDGEGMHQVGGDTYCTSHI